MVRDETQDRGPHRLPEEDGARVAVRYLLEWIAVRGLEFAGLGGKEGGYLVTVSVAGPRADALRKLLHAMDEIEGAGFDSVDYLGQIAVGLAAAAKGEAMPVMAVKRKAP